MDIVEQARNRARNLGGNPEDYLTWQLADEIERLRAEMVGARAIVRAGDAEIERLTDDLQECQSRYGELAGQFRRKDDEIERLTAALREIQTRCHGLRGNSGYCGLLAWRALSLSVDTKPDSA
jgi:chromosome segregation ATPase